jgi:hypothetical protein
LEGIQGTAWDGIFQGKANYEKPENHLAADERGWTRMKTEKCETNPI